MGVFQRGRYPTAGEAQASGSNLMTAQLAVAKVRTILVEGTSPATAAKIVRWLVWHAVQAGDAANAEIDRCRDRLSGATPPDVRSRVRVLLPPRLEGIEATASHV